MNYEPLKSEIGFNIPFFVVFVLINLAYFTSNFLRANSSVRAVVDFVGATTLAFFALLLVVAIRTRKSKQQQLLLSRNSNSVFLIRWALLLICLSLQVAVWIAFAYVNDPLFAEISILRIIKAGLFIWFSLALVSNGIKLGSVKPEYMQWLYVGIVVFLLGLAGTFDVSVGYWIVVPDHRFFPMDMFESEVSNLLLASTVIGGLMLGNWLITNQDDSYSDTSMTRNQV